jgi:FlaA1/EpsC-like NDP-sugar epimerase
MKWRLRSRIYVVGAGLAGITIADEIKARGIYGRVIAFLDDDPAKIGRRVHGIPVMGPIEDALALLNTTPDDEAIIAVPNATREQLQRIYDLLARADFSRIRILPGIPQILEGDAHLILTRDINPEDLLTRNPVQVSLRESLGYVRGRRVLVTGAGGSIGSELARQLLSGGAERLYLFGHGENSVFGIDRELRLLQKEGVGEAATIVPIVGELQDHDYMSYIMGRLRADVVFHTAAHKHVALMEANPVAAVQNNVFGTLNLLDACRNHDVDRFVMISTDKAVEPSCVYGASKLLAEELVIQARREGRRYIVVRFGNVLASRGSILPLFQSQIRSGGPVTLTDDAATRYFMTIPEASSLVLKAGGVDVDADMLLLDMGEPVSIRELVEQMIRFYGYEPDRDIPIEVTGLRPGEKLHERLLSEVEVAQQTSYPKILSVRKRESMGEKLPQVLENLRRVCFYDPQHADLYRNRIVLKKALRRVMPTLELPDDEPTY